MRSGAPFPIHQSEHVPLGVTELRQPQLVVRRPVHEVRLRHELHRALVQRGVCRRDVRNEVVNDRRRVVQFWGLGNAEENGRCAALKKRHLWRRLEEKRHTKRVAVKPDGAVEILGPHEDLADSGQAELLGGGSHTAGSCWVRQCSVPSPHTRSTAWIPTTGRSVISSPSTPSATRSFGSLNVGTKTAPFAM